MARHRLAFVGTDGLASGAQENKMLRAGFWGGRWLPATACTVVLTKGRVLYTALPGHILPKTYTQFRKETWSLLQSFRAERMEFHGYKTGRPEHQLRPNREAVSASEGRPVMFDSATPWTIACQSPLFMEFSRQESWSGLQFPSPGDLPKPGIKPRFPTLQADSLPSEPPGKPNREAGEPKPQGR